MTFVHISDLILALSQQLTKRNDWAAFIYTDVQTLGHLLHQQYLSRNELLEVLENINLVPTKYLSSNQRTTIFVVWVG